MAIEKIERLSGTAVPLPGDNIDTDRIIPARFLKSVSFEGLEDHLFEDDRIQVQQQGGEPHPISDPRYAGAAILVVNANFGCGSSREHAPQAIRRWGIRAVVGESFSEIFFGNSVALGLPCVTVAPADADALIAMVQGDPSVELTVDLSTLAATAGGKTFKISHASRCAGRVPRRQLGRNGTAAGSLRRSRGSRGEIAVRDERAPVARTAVARNFSSRVLTPN